jgi:hypothetical protein
VSYNQEKVLLRRDKERLIEGATPGVAVSPVLTAAIESIVTKVVRTEIEPVKRSLEANQRSMEATQRSLDLVLADLLDPWEKIHSETTSVVEEAETLNLDPVSDFYGTPKKHYCMVLGKVTHSHIKCAHIWPRFTLGRGLEAFDLPNTAVNDPRNFLRLHSAIERAFDHKRLMFDVVARSSSGDLTIQVIVLDPALMSEDLEANDTKVKFGTIHRKAFAYKFPPPKVPFTRLLANHSLQAITKAKTLGWIPEDSQTELFRSNAIEQARRSLGDAAFGLKTFFT